MTTPSAQISVTVASTYAHLEQIAILAHENNKANIDPIVAKEQGFLSVEYSMRTLEAMLESTPPIVALSADDGRVVGYALAATRELALTDELLGEAVELIETHGVLNGVPVRNINNYLIMGQVCVDESVRGKGVVQDMYKLFGQVYAARGFEHVLTEVAATNARSIRAHEKTGWTTYGQVVAKNGVTWNLIALDISTKK